MKAIAVVTMTFLPATFVSVSCLTRRTTAHEDSAEVLKLPRRPCLEQTSSHSILMKVDMAWSLLCLASFGCIGPSQFLRLWQRLLCGSGGVGG
jgi:hypothetical protein